MNIPFFFPAALLTPVTVLWATSHSSPNWKGVYIFGFRVVAWRTH